MESGSGRQPGFYKKEHECIHSFWVDASLALVPVRKPGLGFAMGLASPNPVTQTAAIPFLAPEGDAVVLDVISVTGRLLRRMPLLGHRRMESSDLGR